MTEQKRQIQRLANYAWLLLVFAVYSSYEIFIKVASQYEFLTFRFCLFFTCALGVIFIYAILWQIVLKHSPLSTAYMMKSVTIVYGMLIASIVFGEKISWNNILGCLFIITGIVTLPTLGLTAYNPER